MPKAKKTPGKHYAPRPTSVKVGYQEYAILWIPDKEWRGMDNVSNGHVGEHWGPGGVIRIRIVPEVSEQLYRETLLHEILHAIWFMSAMTGQPEPVEDINDNDQEERIVGRMSPLLVSVLQDNSDVMAYLSGQLYKKKVDQ